MAAIRASAHLDRPAPVQYAIWMGKLLRGDLGESLRNRIPVTELLASKLPVTVELAIGSMLIALAIGIPAGVISAARRGTVIDATANLIALSGLSVPHFWLGIMLILLFAVRLGWLPASGYVRALGGSAPQPHDHPAAVHRARHRRGGRDDAPHRAGPCWRRWAPTTCAPRGPRACRSAWSCSSTRCATR